MQKQASQVFQTTHILTKMLTIVLGTKAHKIMEHVLGGFLKTFYISFVRRHKLRVFWHLDKV